MRKIVIIPSFADLHLLKCWIPNILETIEPDHIIINVGLFPNGPENKGHIDSSFISRWCYNFTNAGFDFPDLIAYCEGNGEIDIKIINYTFPDVNDCFIEAISNFGNIEIQEGDIIFPLEPDAFLLESDKDIINSEISKLKPGEGISCKWVDFLETQYYTERINIEQPKYRRFAYCFDNMENYKAAMSGFMSQNYTKLRKVDSFFIRHYCWFQPEPYKQLRFELIHRSDPQYWKDFEIGLQNIKKHTIDMKRFYHKPPEYVEIRPSRNKKDSTSWPSSWNDPAGWAKFIDIEHPEAIKLHPNFVK